MGKSRLNEVRACPIFFADTKEAISNFILRQPLFCLLTTHKATMLPLQKICTFEKCTTTDLYAIPFLFVPNAHRAPPHTSRSPLNIDCGYFPVDKLMNNIPMVHMGSFIIEQVTKLICTQFLQIDIFHLILLF